MDHFIDPYEYGWGDYSYFEWTHPNQQYQGPPPQGHHQAFQGSDENHVYWPPDQEEFPPCFQPQEFSQYQSNHPPMPHKCLEEMMEDLITSQQLMQNNLQANYNVVHEMHDEQYEQMISLDHLARQMTQLVTCINDMRGNGGGIPAQVQLPREENLNQITLRSGQELKASFNNNSNNGPRESLEQGPRLPSATHCPCQVIAWFEDEEDSDEEIEEKIIIQSDGPIPIPLRPEEAITKWCNKMEHAKSASNLPNPDELPSQCNLPSLRAEEELVSSEVRPPKLELKTLPTNLKHVCFGENDTLPISINSDMENGQGEKLIKELKGPDFLDVEFLQDMYPLPFIEEQVELEGLSKCKLFNTQRLGDEEIEAEIMTWCKKRDHTNPPERCKLSDPKELPSQNELPSPRVEKELLSLEIHPPKLEPIAFPSKLKSLEKNDTISMIIKSILHKSQEKEPIKVLKWHKEVTGWTSADDIICISPDVCVFYMSSEKGSKLYRDPKRKLNASTWKDWKARFDDVFLEEHMYPAQFVEQGSLDANVDKVAESEGAANPAHEAGIETQGGSCTSSATICRNSPYPPQMAGEVISIQPSLLFVVYICCMCDVCVYLKFFGVVALSTLFCMFCGLAGLCNCISCC
ncbi:uncharacterized protein LOC121762999 [Salvia splendens]|uniref:uncharacterized protein LOC121762999 n=1 Tax=Salvia splendens TaxID=180675 RepID=UPI001C262FFC|nr:uncharacterized protein LOC121762999 [Salvia splendens]XP_042014974.1 uncharacterized protein LOC121762999 [Salvia splendens]XP_042014975.1 uncharacterized protein LOC121762999 [Salvia splendens]XP_042014976.1 uncharacterized protein LOC121762999 [Salvia splendens]